jgi:hypothetical protein
MRGAIIGGRAVMTSASVAVQEIRFITSASPSGEFLNQNDTRIMIC